MAASLQKRQERMAQRKKMIDKDHCPNCNIPLREKIQGGMYCPTCNWEKAK